MDNNETTEGDRVIIQSEPSMKDLQNAGEEDKL